MFFEKHLTFSKIPRDVFEKTTVCFLKYIDGCKPIDYE